MRTIFLLVDVENLQRGDLGLLSGANFVVKVFVGANQAKIPLRLSMHFSRRPAAPSAGDPDTARPRIRSSVCATSSAVSVHPSRTKLILSYASIAYSI